MYSQNQIFEMENSLKQTNLIDQDDNIIFIEKGDYWEKLLLFKSQVRGYYYFTRKNIVFIGGLASSTTLSIPYKNIVSLKKCSIGPFLPFGLMVEVYNEKKNKNIKYKLSLMKRDDKINFIQERMRENNNQ